MFLRAGDVGWASFPSILCGVWRELLKLHRLDWRASQVGIRALLFDTRLVRSACRLTLPTDESSVKTILLKMRWIDLSSSAFIPYLYSILFLPLRVLESSLLSIFSES